VPAAEIDTDGPMLAHSSPAALSNELATTRLVLAGRVMSVLGDVIGELQTEPGVQVYRVRRRRPAGPD
jgi:hypothetical protein